MTVGQSRVSPKNIRFVTYYRTDYVSLLKDVRHKATRKEFSQLIY